jgi:hypothetical protein
VAEQSLIRFDVGTGRCRHDRYLIDLLELLEARPEPADTGDRLVLADVDDVAEGTAVHEEAIDGAGQRRTLVFGGRRAFRRPETSALEGEGVRELSPVGKGHRLVAACR